jgi:prophage antirepressor-like protein
MESILKSKSLNVKEFGFYDYVGNRSLRVYGTKDNPLFVAKDVCTILGYKNSREAVKRHIESEDRFMLCQTRCHEKLLLNSQPHLTLINESGLYSLILRSNKPEAKKFKKWVTSDVLPKIRKTGNYQYPVPQNNTKLEYIKVLDAYSSLMTKLGGMDDRDHILIRDLAKNTLTDNNFGLIESKTENQEWSVSRRAVEKFNVKYTNNIKNRCISFGKVLVKKYRELHGKKPTQRLQFVHGSNRNVNCYYLQDWIEFGDNLFLEFFDDILSENEQNLFL